MRSFVVRPRYITYLTSRDRSRSSRNSSCIITLLHLTRLLLLSSAKGSHVVLLLFRGHGLHDLLMVHHGLLLLLLLMLMMKHLLLLLLLVELLLLSRGQGRMIGGGGSSIGMLLLLVVVHDCCWIGSDKG